MSHRTTSFPPYQFPRTVHPISPPDTDFEFGAPVKPVTVLGPMDSLDQTSQLPQQAESTAARFRAVSTLAYNKSGLYEPHERSTTRNSKSLVVILPPENLSREH